MRKKVLFVDLDGVVADFDKGLKKLCPTLDDIENIDEKWDYAGKICEQNPDIFSTLEPIPGAVDAINFLFKHYSNVFDIYFLSTPMWSVPQSFTDKRLWIEKHFGQKVEKRLILSHRKDLNIGDYVIDDTLRHGIDEFKGFHIHFGTEYFPNWDSVITFLLRKEVQQPPGAMIRIK